MWHYNKIYRTRENIVYCTSRGIKISGPPLGRPPKNLTDLERATRKKLARESELLRIPIEGKFGELKRLFSLDRIMEKLENTIKTTISMTVLISNLKKLLRLLFCLFGRSKTSLSWQYLVFLSFLLRIYFSFFLELEKSNLRNDKNMRIL